MYVYIYIYIYMYLERDMHMLFIIHVPLDRVVRVSPQLERDLHGGAHNVGELRHVAAVADACLPAFPKQGF